MEWLTSLKIRISRVGYGVTYGLDIKNQADDTFVQIEAGWTYTIEFDDYLPEMMVALVTKEGKRIKGDRNENSELFCTWQHFDGRFEQQTALYWE